jgi:hypothetical protein
MRDERTETISGTSETYEPPAIAVLGSTADLTRGVTTGDASSLGDLDDN